MSETTAKRRVSNFLVLLWRISSRSYLQIQTKFVAGVLQKLTVLREIYLSRFFRWLFNPQFTFSLSFTSWSWLHFRLSIFNIYKMSSLRKFILNSFFFICILFQYSNILPDAFLNLSKELLFFITLKFFLTETFFHIFNCFFGFFAKIFRN